MFTITSVLHNTCYFISGEIESVVSCVLQGPHIQRRGAVVTIGKLAEHFGINLFAILPNLWAAVVQPLEELPEQCGNGMRILLIKCLILFIQCCPSN